MCFDWARAHLSGVMIPLGSVSVVELLELWVVPELLYTFQELNVLSNVSNVHRSTARFDGLDKTSAPGQRRHRDCRVCERRQTEETERETRGQEVRDREEKGTGEEEGEAERRGRRETERETERVWVGEGGTQRAKGAGQRRQTQQQADKGGVEKTET